MKIEAVAIASGLANATACLFDAVVVPQHSYTRVFFLSFYFGVLKSRVVCEFVSKRKKKKERLFFKLRRCPYFIIVPS